MKYYLVAMFDDNSYEYVEGLQKSINRKYKLSNNNTLPKPHIILDVIVDPDLDKFEEIVEKILRPYKKFKVELNGLSYIDQNNKNFNFKIENKGYIIRIARNINSTLKLSGFNVKEIEDQWNLHVPLANNNLASKTQNSKEYTATIDKIKTLTPYTLAKIDRFELWKSINNKKKTVVQTFSLRDC
ncbi:2'-5' RNA ligase family protein [Clostridium cellulovorans]|uniref:A-kinase anchor protein 7-like phosphoesterase domain-containing protein n=1 Tax=Clostridium cellulovorans (strain ATCC 35296 / DSM 3052 / OCM 3 / 743B) TaxID=573061 RepID=D9SP94_CLOC7|nr:2'-5' RNA ligase family protein [Clostridium cellulovorans]ADL53996.1 hypothetical protein Clocel_4339 [Clostridium cellulovorans 743B]